MASQVESTLARWFTPAFQKSAPLTLDWVRQMIAGTSVEGFIQAARAIQRLNFLERLSALPMPVLVVAGEQDGAASPDVARTLCAHLPQPQLTLIKGAAHQASIEQPVAFSEAVGAFLHSVLISRG
jgi:pimeloyl-ACP methyl ester carboxylesterase